MATSHPTRIDDLLDRLVRLLNSEDRSQALNPAQRSALAYLARANRFSRAPSHVADYLCTTRGTASQTLKTLEKKGMIAREETARDRRSIAYCVTARGHAELAATERSLVPEAALGKGKAALLEDALETVLKDRLSRRGFRQFGICRSCQYHLAGSNGSAHCRLLDVPIVPEETDSLCHEHSAA